MAQSAKAQLSGTYAIGSGDDFETFQEAVDSLLSQGVNGPVTINVDAGTYNEQISITEISGASETNTITFQSASGDSSDVMLTYEAIDYDFNYVVQFSQYASHITFKNLTIHPIGENYGRGIVFGENADHITITNCSFKGINSTQNQSRYASIFGTETRADYLYFYNNQFDSVAMGIYLNGRNTDLISEVEVINNKFLNIGYQSMLFSRAYHGTIKDNEIQGGYIGIRYGTSYENAKILNNRIICKQTGIMYYSAGSLTEKGLIANNYIFITDQGGHCKGISIGGHSPVNIYHNTVVLGDGGLDDHAFSISNFGGDNMVNVTNNIFACMNEGYAYYNSYHSNPLDTLDYNCYYTAGKFLGNEGGKRLFNLDDLRDYLGKDQHSFTTYPVFSPDTSVYPVTNWLNNKGIPLTRVAGDIDGEPRDGSQPDVGAAEFTPPSYALPPYNGDYTIGSDEDFDSLTQAIDSLLLKGVSGEVRLNFSSATHLVHTVIPAIPGTDSDNHLVLQSQTGNPQDALLIFEEQSNTENAYVIKCQGTDFMTVRNLSFKADRVEGPYSRYARVFKFFGGTENLTFTGNHLTSVYDPGREHYAIFFTNDHVHYYDSLVIADNILDSCGVGIYFQSYGQLQQKKPERAYIINNHLSHVGRKGFHFQNHNAPTIKNNVIDSETMGMSLYDCINNTTITGNQIIARNEYGIGISTCNALDTLRGLVANNFISLPGSYDTKGINMLGSEYYNIVYNSVNVISDHGGARAIYTNDGTGHVILNNIFSNVGGGYAAKHERASAIDSMDYNDYYTAGNDLVVWESTICPDLDSLQSASGMDMHSVSIDPVFISDTDLHLNADSLEGLATPLPYVLTDIDGESRDADYPDIGADEFGAVINLPPFVDQPIADLNIYEDSDTTIIARLDTIFTDPNPGDDLTFSVSTSNQYVSVGVADSVLKVKTDTNYFGSAEIIATATDPYSESAHDTFNLTVINVQDDPIAVDDQVGTDQNAAVTVDVLDNDIDVDGDELTISYLTQGTNGSAVVLSGDTLIEYTPSTDFYGEDTLLYGISDGNGGYDTAAIFLLVMGVPVFEEITINLDSVAFGNAEWGDYDDDGDLDILITGEKQGGVNIYSVYENDDGQFTKVSPGLSVEDYGVRCNNDRSIGWCDLDGDNRLEFILTGETTDNEYITEIYDPVEQIHFTTGLPGIFNGSVDWGDYDQDGDPDLLITGETTGSSQITEIYRNDGRGDEWSEWVFTPVSNVLPDLEASQGVWADLDNDQDLDIILTGMDEDGALLKYIYWNEGGTFYSYTSFVAEGQADGSISPCDYDSDGDLDILFTGDNVLAGYLPKTFLMENKDGVFSEVETDIEDVLFSSADWGDYDNDGDFDLVICGKDENLTSITHVYTNNNGVFFKTNFGLPGIAEGTVRWGDYDNDGDLDILLSGYKSDSPNRYTAIYRNNGNEANTPPMIPEDFGVVASDSSAIFTWSRASDAESDSLLLTYNLALGHKDEFRLLMSPMAHEDGYRKVVGAGNSSMLTSRTINNLEPGRLYSARIQTIDAAYAGSEFEEILFNTSSDFFIEDSISFADFYSLSGEFVDYDKDGDLDLIAVNGDMDNPGPLIFENENGMINNDPVMLYEAYMSGIVRAHDYDNDNDVDLLFTEIGNEENVAVYTNQEGSFIPTELDVKGIEYCEAAWGDFDNDGDADLILSGLDEGGGICKLYRNNDGSFEDYSHPFSSVIYGDIRFVDYDSDGDLDVFLCGASYETNDLSDIIFKIYENRGGAFDLVNHDIPGVVYSSMDIGDFDNDGDPDLLICGLSEEDEAVTRIYRNDNADFVLYESSLTPVINGDCKWADFNNDGLLDIMLSGINNSDVYSDDCVTEIYYNHEGTFAKVMELDGFVDAQFILGDYNMDQNLDFLITGNNKERADMDALFYKNSTSVVNSVPDFPEILSVDPAPTSATFSWTQASDTETPVNGLTYNLRIGTTPGGSEVLSPLSMENGIRQVVDWGNTQQNTTWVINGLDSTTTYYYSVQTIDNGKLASEFTSEKTFVYAITAIDETFSYKRIYPNPTTGIIRIDTERAGKSFEAEVINTTGAVIVRKQTNDSGMILDISDLPKGIYILRLRSGGQVVTQKIVKY